jgi:hypothetical protein
VGLDSSVITMVMEHVCGTFFPVFVTSVMTPDHGVPKLATYARVLIGPRQSVELRERCGDGVKIMQLKQRHGVCERATPLGKRLVESVLKAGLPCERLSFSVMESSERVS